MSDAPTIETPAGLSARRVTLSARPEALRLPVDETAVIVVDMQNAYASEGGYVDLAGFDISGAQGVIGRIAAVLDTARAAGMPGRLPAEWLGPGL